MINPLSCPAVSAKTSPPPISICLSHVGWWKRNKLGASWLVNSQRQRGSLIGWTVSMTQLLSHLLHLPQHLKSAMFMKILKQFSSILKIQV
jgi:hypothetical protein